MTATPSAPVPGRIIKVMVVDDSSVARGMLRRRIDGEPDLDLVATASNGRSAIDALDGHEIDVALMDVHMPEMDGLTAIPLMLAKRPDLKIIMVSSYTSADADVTMEALRLGAADFVCKPSSLAQGMSFDEVMVDLVAKIRGLTQGKRSRPAAPAGTTPAKPHAQIPAYSGERPDIVAIGSSTGGPQALQTVLQAIPDGVQQPIVIVQHMPAIFLSLLAQRLGKGTRRTSILGKQGEPIRPGHIYLAPGDFHMEVLRGADGPLLTLNERPPENFCRPAVDPLFRSVAKAYGSKVLGVVLTGMGEDGCAGARELVAAGGTIVAQDEETSVVWGMPGAVTRAGLTSAVLPIEDVAAYITQACGVVVG